MRTARRTVLAALKFIQKPWIGLLETSFRGFNSIQTSSLQKTELRLEKKIWWKMVLEETWSQNVWIHWA